MTEETTGGDEVYPPTDLSLALLYEPDTPDTLKIGGTFGLNQEYYCLYLNFYRYMPWAHHSMIEFRPFRNVRIYGTFKNISKKFMKVGYFTEWLLDPPYTHQLYNNGEPCEGQTNKTRTFVTFLCGRENRIISFKTIKKCLEYEIFFETSFHCVVRQPESILNALAIQKYGPEDYTFMKLFCVVMGVYIIFLWILSTAKKSGLF